MTSATEDTAEVIAEPAVELTVHLSSSDESISDSDSNDEAAQESRIARAALATGRRTHLVRPALFPGPSDPTSAFSRQRASFNAVRGSLIQATLAMQATMTKQQQQRSSTRGSTRDSTHASGSPVRRSNRGLGLALSANALNRRLSPNQSSPPRQLNSLRGGTPPPRGSLRHSSGSRTSVNGDLQHRMRTMAINLMSVEEKQQYLDLPTPRTGSVNLVKHAISPALNSTRISQLTSGSIRVDSVDLGSVGRPSLTETDKDMIYQALCAAPVFSMLSQKERLQVAGCMSLKSFKDGTTIITQGDLGEGLYVIKSGSVRIFANVAMPQSPTGLAGVFGGGALSAGAPKQLTRDIAIGHKGDYFGEAALLTNQARGASVAAQGDVTVCFLDRSFYNTLFKLGNFSQIAFAKRRGVGRPEPDIDTVSKSTGFAEFRPPPNARRDKSQLVQRLIYKTVKHNILFEGMSKDAMRKVVADMWQYPVRKGTVVIKQGQVGDNFYVVEKGRFNVYIHGPDGTSKRKVDVIGRKQCFGELALMYDTPRNATVAATTDAVLWSLDRFAFRRVLQNIDLRKIHKYMHFLSGVSLLAPLSHSERQKIAEALEEQRFRKGEAITKHSEVGEAMYVISSGRCTVERPDEDAETGLRLVKILERGECFGERALLTNEPRSASVTALTSVTVLRLGTMAFKLLLGPLEEILQNAVVGYDHSDEAKARVSISTVAIKRDSQLEGHEEETLDEALADHARRWAFSQFLQSEYSLDNLTFYDECVSLLNSSMKPKAQLDHATSLLKFFINPTAQRQVSLPNAISAALHRELKSSVEAAEGDVDNAAEILTKVRPLIIDARDTMLKLMTTDSFPRFKQSPFSKPAPRPSCDVDRNDLVVETTLGKGSYASVQLVRDTTTGDTYALKRVAKKRMTKPRHKIQILAEKNLMMKLEHPCIIRLYGTFKDTENLYFLLEPCLGGELFSLLRTHTRLDQTPARFYAGSVVLAWEFMHSKKIIHRDLKPENCLLDSRGFMKMADFGFAKELDDEGRTYTICGTPQYFAPELVTGSALTIGVDWWCLGVFLFELLAGFTPFFDCQAQALGLPQDVLRMYKRIAECEVRYPREFSAEAKDIISKLLMRKPTQRLGVIAGGANAVKAHPFFTGLDFEGLLRRQIRPPLIPFIEDNADTRNFNVKARHMDTHDIRKQDSYHAHWTAWDAEF